MPVGLRNVEPVFLGARPLNSEVEEKCKSTHLTVANNSIVGVLLQLGSLVRHADDLFCDISDECQKVFDRTDSLCKRIGRISENVAKLDAKQVPVPVGDLTKFSHVDEHHEAKHGYTSHIFTANTRPQCIVDQYNLAEPTPIKVLRSADLYRKDGLCGSKLFKFWPVILNEPKIRTPDLNLPRRVQRVKSFEKKYKKLKIRERPKTIHGLEQFMLEDNKNELTEQEEQCLTKSQPSIMVPIDTSGTNFERMQSLRLSGRSSKEETAKRKKRRRTFSGVPQNIMNEIEKFERKQKCVDGPKVATRSYSFDDLDAEDDLERDEGMMKYLDELDGKMEERMEEERASREPKIMKKLFPCRRSRSLPRCVKLGSVSRSLSGERKSLKDLNSTYADSSLSIASLTSSVSSRMSRSTKRSSIISSKLKSLVTGGSGNKEKQRPKSLDLDELLNQEDEKENFEPDLAKHRTPSMPDGILSRTQSSERDEKLGPGSYYNFESSTLPRTQAKKYDFPWESLPKDWTTSVRLREISKRRSREDRQSSSGNWSGTTCSSNRQSMDSDHAKSDGIPYNSQYSLGKDSGRDSLNLEEEFGCGTDGTNTTVNFGGDERSIGDTASLGRRKTKFTPDDTHEWLKGLAIRAASRSEVSSSSAESLSRLTRQNILALDLMLTHSEQKPRTIEDEESSVYSVDQEGFYTSFHNDSGLKKSTNTLVDEDEFSHSKDTQSVCSVDSVIHVTDSREKFAALRKGNSNSKVLSKVTPPTPPLRTTSKHNSDIGQDLPLKKVPSNESSMSESDQEAVFARVEGKTRISTHMYPSWCEVTTDDDSSSPESATEKARRKAQMKGSNCIFSENQCEVVDLLNAYHAQEGRTTSEVLSHFSYSDEGSSFNSSKGDNSLGSQEEASLRHSKSALECSDLGYESLTLPKRKSEDSLSDKGNQQMNGYQSWPRTHKTGHPASGILKTPEKASDGSRPPKSLNFAPMVNMFNPGTPNAIQMPLPSPSTSSSDENNLCPSASTFQSMSSNGYKLSVPLEETQSGEKTSKDRQLEKVPVPMKYQPQITVKPGARSGDCQNLNYSHSQQNSLPPKPQVMYATPSVKQTGPPVSQTFSNSDQQNTNLYAVSPVGNGPSAGVGTFKQGSDLYASQVRAASAYSGNSGNYFDMHGFNLHHNKMGSMSSLASSECLNFSENNTYVSMSSHCSSPNLSNLDVPMMDTPSGSMDSLADLRHTPTNGLEKDTYYINTNLHHSHGGKPKSVAMETVPIVTTSNYISNANSSFGSQSGSYRSFDRTSSSSRDSSMSSFQNPSEHSNNSSMSSDLTFVSQMSPSQYDPISSSTPSNTVSVVQRRGDKSQTYRSTSDSERRRSRENPIYSHGLADTQTERRNSETKKSSSLSQGSSQKKGLTPSKSMPSNMSQSTHQPVIKRQGANRDPNQGFSKHHSHRSSLPSQLQPSDFQNLTSSKRSDSAQVSPQKSRNSSYRVASMHASKSLPSFPPTTQSGPYKVALNMSPRSHHMMSYEEPINRADSYRYAVQNTNGLVKGGLTEIANRNTSYRVAVNDDMPIMPVHQLDALDRKNSGMPGGRDVRRMGITDVDQVKGIASEKVSTKSPSGTNSGQFAQIKSSITPKRVAKPNADPIEFLASMDYNKNDTRKTNKNENRSSTYICFDPIYEDREDFGTSTESLGMSMSSLSASIKTLTPDSSYDMQGVNTSSNPGYSSQASKSKYGSNGAAGLPKSRKSKPVNSNIEIEDDWRFSQV